MPDRDAYEKLKRGLGLAPQIQEQPQVEEPSFLEGYKNVVSDTFEGAARKLAQGLSQISPPSQFGERESNIGAGIINTLTGFGELGFAPISSAFAVGDKALRDVGLSPVADVINFGFELPAKAVSKGSDFIEKNIYGVKDSAKLLGVKEKTMQEIYDASKGMGELIGTLVGLKGYSAIGKSLKSKFRGKAPKPAEVQNYIVEEIQRLPEAPRRIMLKEAEATQRKLLAENNVNLLPENATRIYGQQESFIDNVVRKLQKPEFAQENVKGKRVKDFEPIPTETQPQFGLTNETLPINLAKRGKEKVDFKPNPIKSKPINGLTFEGSDVFAQARKKIRQQEIENATKNKQKIEPEIKQVGITDEVKVRRTVRSLKKIKAEFKKNLTINESEFAKLYEYAPDKKTRNKIEKLYFDLVQQKRTLVPVNKPLPKPFEMPLLAEDRIQGLFKPLENKAIEGLTSEYVNTEPMVKKSGAEKTADSFSKRKIDNVPLREEYNKTDTKTETADINRSRSTDVTEKYTQPKAEAVAKEQVVSEKTLETQKAELHAQGNKIQNESFQLYIKKKKGEITPEQYLEQKKVIDTKTQKLNELRNSIELESQNLYKEVGGQLSMGVPLTPKALTSLAKIGKSYVELGYTTFKSWAKELISKFGDAIKPHLRKLWTETNKDLKPQSPEAKKITESIKKSKIDRKKTDQLYAEARGQKYAKLMDAIDNAQGEGSIPKVKGALKGELPKADFESVRKNFSQKEIDNLYNEIWNSSLNGWEKVNAVEGLSKVLGEKGGKVPTASELDILKQVYGEQFTRALQGKKPMWDKVKSTFTDIINIPRSLVTSLDMSAALRQGLILTVSRPRQSIPAIKAMHKYFFSDKAYKALAEDIKSRGNSSLYEKSGLYIAKESIDLAKREEAFMSHIAERIPVLGTIVRASERAYVGYLNKLRADVFDSIAKDLRKEGVTFSKDPKTYQDIANFINMASGRGSLGKYGNRVAPVLNGAFFSIRNLAAKVQLMNPTTYIKMSKRARVTAAKDMVATLGTVSTMIALADMIPGVSVEKDPRSADFMKVRFRNTRVDPWGGFQQFIRFTAQMISGETKSSISGKVRKLDAKKFPFETRLDRALSFVGSKVSPQLSIAGDVLRGETMFGEDLEVDSEVYKRLSPLYIQDIIDASNELGIAPSAVFAMLGFYGAGVQTYGKRKKTTKTNSTWKF